MKKRGSRGEVQPLPSRLSVSIRTQQDAASPILLGDPIGATMTDFLSAEPPIDRTPLDALLQLITCGLDKRLPPEWAVEQVVQVIFNYLTCADAESRSLDFAFGFLATRGKTSEGHARMRKLRDLRIVNSIWKLTTIGLTVKEAARRVVNRLHKAKEWNQTRYSLPLVPNQQACIRTFTKYYYQWKSNELERLRCVDPSLITRLEAWFRSEKNSLLGDFPHG